MSTITILAYTLLMMGITFIVGFAVAGLIKMMTSLLPAPQKLSARGIDLQHHAFMNEHLRLLRSMALSETKEASYPAFQFLHSHNKKSHSELPDRFAYAISHNVEDKKRTLPEVFDFRISHNNK